MTSAFRLELGADGVAFLIFDLPNEKVNKFSIPVLEELDNLLDIAKKNSSIKILVVKSSKPNMFAAGADLKIIELGLYDTNFARKILELGHRVFCKLSDLPFPTLAVIDGACLGGGAEMALACTYRIGSDNEHTKIGFPEVDLGLFPGWGGTQRLPKLIGLNQALKMILSGKSIDSKKALKIKFLDAECSQKNLNENLQAFISKCLDSKGKKAILKIRKSKDLSHFLMENNPVGIRFLFYSTKKKLLKKSKKLYPEIFVTFDLIKKTYKMPLKKGLKLEQETFINSIPKIFKNAKNLIRLFFATQEIKKNPGDWVEKLPTSTLPIKLAGVIGAGILGAEIAWLFSHHNIPVKLKDANWQKIGEGCTLVYSAYHKLLKLHKLKLFEVERKFQNLTLTTTYSHFKNINIVIEAASEDLELKRKIFYEIEQVVSESTIIASHTYSLLISEISKSMNNSDRFIGMHFAPFINEMSLVEIIPGMNTSKKTIAYAIEVCKKLKKNPIIVKDSPGFLLNRIFAPAINEAFWLLYDGIKAERIDRVIKEFGMPMGPCFFSDEFGNDTMCQILNFLSSSYGERMKPCEVLISLVNAGCLGRKCKNKKNFEMDILIHNITKLNRPVKDAEIVDRFTLMMINEAARCLEEKIVASPLHLDMALLYGIGFPSFRFGLLGYADSVGIKNIIAKLNHYTKICGSRFTPSDYLLKIKSFY